MFDKKIDFPKPDASWRIEASGDGESVRLFDDRAICTVGGAGIENTNYARVRQMELSVPLDTPFTMEADIELPPDFYAKQVDYFRLLGTDNFPIALNGQTWRIGVVIYSDHLCRLVVQHRHVGVDETVLAKLPQLPLGRHRYSFAVNASRTAPLTKFYIDGAPVVDCKSPNVPDLQPSEQQLRRMAWGIDGAAGYGNGKTLSLTLFGCRVYSGFPPENDSCLRALLGSL